MKRIGLLILIALFAAPLSADTTTQRLLSKALADARYLQLSGGTLTGPLTGTSNIVELRNGTNGQTLRIFGTYTDASNNERLGIACSGSACLVVTNASGTGTSRPLQLGSGGTASYQYLVTGGAYAPVIDLTYDLGSSALRVKNAWLSRINATGTAPTSVAVGTGFGTSPSVALDTGSSDTAGTATITVGTGGTATSGSVVLTFSAALGTNTARCVAIPVNGAAAWTSKATAIVSAQSTTATTFFLENNGIALTASTTYKLNYICFGG